MRWRPTSPRYAEGKWSFGAGNRTSRLDPRGGSGTFLSGCIDHLVPQAFSLRFETDMEELVSAPGLAGGEPLLVAVNDEQKGGVAVGEVHVR